jgi:hypothetical protein
LWPPRAIFTDYTIVSRCPWGLSPRAIAVFFGRISAQYPWSVRANNLLENYLEIPVVLAWLCGAEMMQVNTCMVQFFG